MKYLEELLNVSKQLNIGSSYIKGIKAKEYISKVLSKFNPEKTNGHLNIGGNSLSLPTEIYEFTFSKILPKIEAYVFFEQDSFNKDSIYIINDLSLLCSVMEESYGMEYFVSNERLDFLISVNWYVIQGTGAAKQYLSLLV